MGLISIKALALSYGFTPTGPETTTIKKITITRKNNSSRDKEGMRETTPRKNRTLTQIGKVRWIPKYNRQIH